MRLCHVGQAGLQRLISSDSSTLDSQNPGITGVSHDAWPDVLFFRESREHQGRYLGFSSLFHISRERTGLWKGGTSSKGFGCMLELEVEWHGVKKQLGQVPWLMPVIPALWEAKAGISQGQEIKTILVNMVKPLSTKNTKISQAWWHTPIVPATREAEAGESLEPGCRGCSEPAIVPLHSNLGNNSKTPSRKK